MHFSLGTRSAGLILLLLLASVALTTGCNVTEADVQSVKISEEVLVTGGAVRGTRSEDGELLVFKGLPFAAPPVDELRWRYPEAVEPWQGVREADSFSPACLQNKRSPNSFYGPGADDVDEDCLYLNVWTTAKTQEDRLPVMVWIHGGALRNGHGGIPTYNGENFARNGVVLVTINYRLGPLGFLAHPVLSNEDPYGSSGNYGLVDQVAALRWVQENITAFGGDRDRVTIFGESAGSFSVNYLQASPLAAGLFHRAIGESGTALNGSPPIRGKATAEGEAAETAGQRFVAKLLGLREGEEPSAEALRAASGEAVLATFATPGVNFPSRGNVDGWFLPDTVSSIFENGRQNDVPVIAGWNADEGPSLIGDGGIHTLADYREMVTSRYGDRAEEYLAVYPASNDEEARAASLKAAGAQIFGQGTRRWVRLQSQATANAFLYHFERVPPGRDSERYGSYHAAEIAYVFGTLDAQDRPWADTDRTLSETMAAYWVSFAEDGDPNADGLPEWPTYDTAKDPAMVFGDSVRVEHEVRKVELDLLDSLAAVSAR